MCLYLKDKSISIKVIVMNFWQRSVTVIVPEFDIEKNLFFNEIPSIKGVSISKKGLELSIKF